MRKALLLISAILYWTCCFSVQAQSLKDLFNKDNIGQTLGNIAESVLTNQGIIKTDITGNWTYAGADCKFLSEDFAKQAGGALVANQLSEKLDNVYAKVGIREGAFHFQFNSDSTFVTSLGAKELKGTYTLNENELVLEYKIAGSFRLGTVNAHIQKAGTDLSILYKADKLLTLFGQLCSITKIKALETVANLSDSYDGMLIGYKLKKN